MSDDLGLFDPDVDVERERRPSTKSKARAAAARKKRKQKKTVLWIVVAMVLALGAGGAYYGYRELRGIGSWDDYSGTGESDVIIEVKDGDPVSEIASTLQKNGVVASPRAFTEASKTDQRVTAIQPGFYVMKTRMSGASAVARMIDPKTKVGALQVVGGVILRDLTGGDGKVVKGIYTQLSEASCTERGGQKVCVPVEEIKAAAETADPGALGVPDWAIADVKAAPPEFRLEGLIMRGVYQVNPGVSAVEMLRGVITASAQKLQGYGIPSNTGDTGFRPYEVLVMASLIEKEGIEKDFGSVSRVIYNRLKLPMKLQFDSTVNYKLNQPHIRTSDANRQAAGAYNTYSTGGLPPTPIGSPSIKAIEAALKPADGNMIYFVKCQKDGTSCFSDNQEQHDIYDAKARAEGVF
ncbi:endolytic transglycosylase MltG [Lentzea tibetensis]|uniref:Endolytic murein transglycosylase n=1 Tax=Lentzea tibetensis TaxID=2591470 RepID=A0A563ET60_9PSEU|nr:endolytic transglycosylase MltG [Lentzea tibetensis]TWP50856.1 endolytic transglycosylase MltG [Lentzea tibetensis]